MTDTPQIAPAGWHPDPAGSGQLRWWNGSAWTEHLQPAVPVAPTPVVLAPTVPPPAPQATPEPAYRFNAAPGASTGASSALTYSDEPIGWNTPGGWAVAFTPLVSAAAVALLVGASLAGIHAPWTLAAIVVLPFLYTLIAAARDRKRLGYLGFTNPPSVAWILLFPPLVYLIVRTVRVYGRVRHGIGPLIAYIVVSVVVTIGAIAGGAALVPIVLEQVGTQVSSAAATRLQSALNATGRSYVVTCPPSVSVQVGTKFTCTAVDQATSRSYAIVVDVVAGSNGSPDLKVESFTPSGG